MRGIGKRASVIARRRRDDSFFARGLIEGQDGVERASDLEGMCFIGVFQLEPGPFAQLGRGFQRRRRQMRPQALPGADDVAQGDGFRHGSQTDLPQVVAIARRRFQRRAQARQDILLNHDPAVVSDRIQFAQDARKIDIAFSQFGEDTLSD